MLLVTLEASSASLRFDSMAPMLLLNVLPILLLATTAFLGGIGTGEGLVSSGSPTHDCVLRSRSHWPARDGVGKRSGAVGDRLHGGWKSGSWQGWAASLSEDSRRAVTLHAAQKAANVVPSTMRCRVSSALEPDVARRCPICASEFKISCREQEEHHKTCTRRCVIGNGGGRGRHRVAYHLPLPSPRDRISHRGIFNNSSSGRNNIKRSIQTSSSLLSCSISRELMFN